MHVATGTYNTVKDARTVRANGSGREGSAQGKRRRTGGGRPDEGPDFEITEIKGGSKVSDRAGDMLRSIESSLAENTA